MSENYIRNNSVARKEMQLKQKKGRKLVDHVPYFIIHNLISMLLFFLSAWLLGLFEKRTEVISDLFEDYYLPFYGTTVFLMLFFGILARIIAYFAIMQPFYKSVLKKPLREFMMLNDGMNKLSFGFIISVLLNAFFFTVGALFIIQSTFFNSATFITLILAYIIMKGITYALMKIGRYFIVHIITGMKI